MSQSAATNSTPESASPALPLTRFGRWMAMPRFHRWEAFGMRFLFALVVWKTLPLVSPVFPLFRYGQPLATAGQLDFHSQPYPVGLAHWFDLTFFSNPAMQPVLWVLASVAIIAYIAGRGMIVAVPVLAAINVLSHTLINSQGYTAHKMQLVSLILVAQTVAVFYYHGRILFAKLRKKRKPTTRPLYEYFIRFSQIVVVAGYVIAGASKIELTEGRWVMQSHYIGVAMVKTDRQHYYSKLEGDKYGGDVPLATSALKHANITRVLMAGGLCLELFAFLGLASRLAGVVIGLGLILFHIGVERTMGLHFHEYEHAVWIFLVNLPFWIGMTGLFLWGKVRPRKFDADPAPAVE